MTNVSYIIFMIGKNAIDLYFVGKRQIYKVLERGTDPTMFDDERVCYELM